MIVGDWVSRARRGVPHLVESIVADDVVTRCGKRMRDEPNRDGELVVSGPGERRCKVCS